HHARHKNRLQSYQFLLVMLKLVHYKASDSTADFPNRTSDFPKCFPVLDIIDLSGINMYALPIDYMPEKLYFLNPKFTLREFGVQLLFR
ncbi:hypothetical protein Tco_0220403, partial [Tanacetum coccineum]